jgi:hypothetical protein
MWVSPRFDGTNPIYSKYNHALLLYPSPGGDQFLVSESIAGGFYAGSVIHHKFRGRSSGGRKEGISAAGKQDRGITSHSLIRSVRSDTGFTLMVERPEKRKSPSRNLLLAGRVLALAATLMETGPDLQSMNCRYRPDKRTRTRSVLVSSAVSHLQIVSDDRTMSRSSRRRVPCRQQPLRATSRRTYP